MNANFDPAYLSPGQFVDSDHPKVAAFAREHAKGSTPRERAVSLYYAVRDGVRYNPFQNFTADEAYRGSACLERREGWCVPKAALLAAKMGTDLFVFHGYTDLLLDGKWVKATPAFNLAMCKRFRVKPLEFDGAEDSIFHPFDEDDRRHMEYVQFRGTYADVPADDIRRVFSETYPAYFNLGPGAQKERFEPA
jgi:transglutaminase-like putative cysteine protease